MNPEVVHPHDPIWNVLDMQRSNALWKRGEASDETVFVSALPVDGIRLPKPPILIVDQNGISFDCKGSRRLYPAMWESEHIFKMILFQTGKGHLPGQYTQMGAVGSYRDLCRNTHWFIENVFNQQANEASQKALKTLQDWRKEVIKHLSNPILVYKRVLYEGAEPALIPIVINPCQPTHAASRYAGIFVDGVLEFIGVPVSGQASSLYVSSNLVADKLAMAADFIHLKRLQGVEKTSNKTTRIIHLKSQSGSGNVVSNTTIDVKSCQALLESVHLKSKIAINITTESDLKIKPNIDQMIVRETIHREKNSIIGKRQITDQTVKRAKMSQETKIETERFTAVSKRGDLELAHLNSTASINRFSAPLGKLSILAGHNDWFFSQVSGSESLFWQSQVSRTRRSVKHSHCCFAGVLETDAKETVIDIIDGQSPDFMKRIADRDNLAATYRRLQSCSHETKHKIQGPTEALTALVGIGMTFATGGIGAGATKPLEVALSAGFSNLCSKGAIALLQNEGNPFKALKSLCNSKTLVSVGTSMLSAGVMRHLKLEFELDKFSPEFISRFKYHFVQASVDTVLNVSLNGQKPGEALLNGIRQASASLVMTTTANEFADHDPYAQQFSKALAGAVAGGILKGPDGAFSGLIGSIAAEISANIASREVSSMVGAVSAVLLKQDPNIAYQVSSGLSEAFAQASQRKEQERLEREQFKHEQEVKLEQERYERVKREKAERLEQERRGQLKRAQKAKLAEEKAAEEKAQQDRFVSKYKAQAHDILFGNKRKASGSLLFSRDASFDDRMPARGFDQTQANPNEPVITDYHSEFIQQHALNIESSYNNILPNFENPMVQRESAYESLGFGLYSSDFNKRGLFFNNYIPLQNWGQHYYNLMDDDSVPFSIYTQPAQLSALANVFGNGVLMIPFGESKAQAYKFETIQTLRAEKEALSRKMEFIKSIASKAINNVLHNHAFFNIGEEQKSRMLEEEIREKTESYNSEMKNYIEITQNKQPQSRLGAAIFNLGVHQVRKVDGSNLGEAKKELDDLTNEIKRLILTDYQKKLNAIDNEIDQIQANTSPLIPIMNYQKPNYYQSITSDMFCCIKNSYLDLSGAGARFLARNPGVSTLLKGAGISFAAASIAAYPGVAASTFGFSKFMDLEPVDKWISNQMRKKSLGLADNAQRDFATFSKEAWKFGASMIAGGLASGINWRQLGSKDLFKITLDLRGLQKPLGKPYINGRPSVPLLPGSTQQTIRSGLNQNQLVSSPNYKVPSTSNLFFRTQQPIFRKTDGVSMIAGGIAGGINWEQIGNKDFFKITLDLGRLQKPLGKPSIPLLPGSTQQKIGRGLNQQLMLNYYKLKDLTSPIFALKEQELNPNLIMFSQSSVNNVELLVASMKKYGWKSGEPLIDVVRMPNGTLITLDNTRVLAAHEVGINVRATIRNFDDPLPKKYLELGRFRTKANGDPATWGEAVQFRINKQVKKYRITYPNGSIITGIGVKP